MYFMPDFDSIEEDRLRFIIEECLAAYVQQHEFLANEGLLSKALDLGFSPKVLGDARIALYNLSILRKKMRGENP